MTEQPEQFTTISVTYETRDELRSRKRGGESYDELLRKMVDQYGSETDQKEGKR